MINTNSNTGKNEREYSTVTFTAAESLPPLPPRRQTNLSSATTIPVNTVRRVRISARLMLKTQFSLVHTQDGEERLLRNLDGSYLFHAPLAGLLFLQQFALAADITAITLRCNVLA